MGWPLLSFARIYNPNISATTVLILILLSFILAALTHAGIEKRFQNKNYDISPLSTKHNRKSIAIISVLLLSMLTLYAGAERLQKPADKEVNKLYVIDESILNLVPSCLIAADFVTENKVAWCKRDPVPRAVEGVVIGDSHAHAAFIGMATDESKIAWQLVANHSCPPYPSGLDSPCNKMIEKTYEKIKEAKDLKFVVLIMANRVFQENRQTLNRENIVAEIKKLTQSGKTIVIVRPVPEIAEHIDSCLFQRFPFYEKYDTSDQCSISTTDWKQTSLDYNTFINYIKSQLPTVLVVDPAREICDAKTCNSIKNNISLYNDKDHLSYLGSRLVARNINWAINFYLGK